MDETTARKALGFPRERGGNRETVKDETFAEPRALRQARALDLVRCRFEGGEEAAGALGSCVDVTARGCRFRSPRAFAGARLAVLRDCRFAGTSRAPLWHGAYLDLVDCDIAGNSALRGCAEVSLEGCDVVSDEFGWECDRVRLANSSVRGDRALLLSTHLKLEGVRLMGPRALQGVRDVVIERCEIDSDEAFDHACGIVVRDSVLRGSGIGRHARDVRLERCTIIGDEPFSQAKNVVTVLGKREEPQTIGA